MDGGTGPARRPGGPLFAGKSWFWTPIVPLVVLDLWSKQLVFDWLPQPGSEHALWTGPVSFSLVHWTNTGTIWGLGQNLTAVLIALRCAALVALVWFAWRTPKQARLQLVMLGLVMAGALGNLYDNFTQERGAVRDFLLFFVGSGSDRKVFPAFNVADSCITVGAIGLLTTLFRPERASAGEAERVS